jgi:hypothetical protein
MKNWSNWTWRELVEVIDSSKKKGQTTIVISQEHTDWQNDKQVERWLAEMNLEFETEMERTTIKLK